MPRAITKKLTISENIALYNFLKEKKDELKRINATMATAHKMFVKASGIPATEHHVNHMIARQPEVCWNDDWLPAQKLNRTKEAQDLEAVMELLRGIEQRVAKLEHDFSSLHQMTRDILGSQQ